MFKLFDSKIKVEIAFFLIVITLQEDSSGSFAGDVSSGDGLHGGTYMCAESIFEEISVISFDADFGIFDQKCIENLFIHDFCLIYPCACDILSV